MVKMKGVCKECQNREVGCHGHCETYLNAKAEMQEEKDRIYKAKNLDRMYENFVVHSQERRHGKNRDRK